MGNSVSQCGLCEESFTVNEFIQLQLCGNDYDYIVRLIKEDRLPDTSRGFSKSKIAALVLVMVVGYYWWESRSENKQLIDDLNWLLRENDQRIVRLSDSVHTYENNAYQSRQEIKRLKKDVSCKNELNVDLTTKNKSLEAAISHKNRAISDLTSNLRRHTDEMQVQALQISQFRKELKDRSGYFWNYSILTIGTN